MDFATLATGAKIWNNAWPSTTYLEVVVITVPGEAEGMALTTRPKLTAPERKLMLHQANQLPMTFQTNQAALLDINWTTEDPSAAS